MGSGTLNRSNIVVRLRSLASRLTSAPFADGRKKLIFIHEGEWKRCRPVKRDRGAISESRGHDKRHCPRTITYWKT